MKHLYITTALALCSICAIAQKKHIYYDTVKTVTERVDYAPDTIPVYFKEIIITTFDTVPGLHFSAGITERWTKGYVIWQTYKKQPGWGITGTVTGSGYLTSISTQPQYYKDDFKPTEFTDNIFLYADRKTKVKNRVLYTILR